MTRDVNVQIGSVAGHVVTGGSAHGNVTNYAPDRLRVERAEASSDGGGAHASSSTLRIVYATADPPSSTAKLALDREVRAIKHLLDRMGVPDVEFEHLLACSAQDLLEELTRRDATVVSFSGHASEHGVLLDDGTRQPHLVPYERLASILAVNGSPPKLVILNACHSLSGAEDLLATVPAVVGMRWEVGDQAACAFASGFYDAILARRSLEVAMRRGIAQLQVKGFDEDAQTPCLRVAPTVDPGQFRLLDPGATASSDSV